MKTRKIFAAMLMASLATGASAQAGKDNLSTLKQMKVATTDLNIPVVPRNGATRTRYAPT